jgi:putative hydrolase of the HAD superfamily
MRPLALPPAALLFDAMGTLLRLAAPVPALRRELAQRFGVHVSDADAQRALEAEIAYYRAHLHEGATAPSLAELRGRCAEVLRGALAPTPALDAVSAADLTDVLLDALSFEAFPDALPALQAARARGQRAVVVSNWDCSLPEVFERLGLAPWLHGVLTSAQVGAAKPSPVIFAAALALAGCRAHEALHVGDSLAEDVAGARAAGVPVLLLARDGAPGPEGVTTIRSLDELRASNLAG